MGTTSNQWQAGAILSMAILSLLTTVQLLRIIFVPSEKYWGELPPTSIYTSQDDDYPPFLTIPFGPPVKMDFEETVHYPLTLQDGFDDEWLYNLPFGTGSYRIANEDGLIVTEIAAFHQLHCLRLFVRDMNPHNSNASLGHSHHCLNYLRQSFLCEADTTLEPKEFFTKNATQYQYYGHPTRVCRDWTVLYDALEDNWRDWRLHHASNTTLN